MTNYGCDKVVSIGRLCSKAMTLVGGIVVMMLVVPGYVKDDSASALEFETLTYTSNVWFIGDDYHVQATYMRGFLDAMVYVRQNALPTDEFFDCVFGHEFTGTNGYIFSDPVADKANEMFRDGNEEFSIPVVTMDVIDDMCEDIEAYFDGRRVQ